MRKQEISHLFNDRKRDISRYFSKVIDGNTTEEKDLKMTWLKFSFEKKDDRNLFICMKKKDSVYRYMSKFRLIWLFKKEFKKHQRGWKIAIVLSSSSFSKLTIISTQIMISFILHQIISNFINIWSNNLAFQKTLLEAKNNSEEGLYFNILKKKQRKG